MAGKAFADHRDCLSEDEALAYVSSQDLSARDPSLEGHVDSCTPCRMMLAEAARATSESMGHATEQSTLVHSRSGEDELPIRAARRPGGPSTPTSLAVGEVLLSRYTIVRFVARGGMGEVYEAYDDVLGETVALKTLVCTDLDRPAAMQRLMAEVRIARQVTHPNVCRIYEFGMHEAHGRRGREGEPVPFLTMEFLRGETLDRRLARVGRFDPDHLARLVPHMVAGLAAIHAAGIIHRDIKPANMALLPGPPERLVLMDFGLAREANPLASSHSLSGGRLVGTIDYMAPEQVVGQAATRQVDIYAIGLVIFELLTGRRPFAGSDALASAVERMITPAPAPSQLVPGLPAGWDAFIARCLAPDPAGRFANADELAAFVEAQLSLPAHAPRAQPETLAAFSPMSVSASTRARPAWRSRRAVLGATAAALAGLAIFAGMRWAGAPGDPPGDRWTGVVGLAGAKAPVRPALINPERKAAATGTGCSADMVRVADRFCIDRFEATVVDDMAERSLSPYYPPSPDLVPKVLEDWDRRSDSRTTGLPVPLPELPAWQRKFGWRPRALSRPGVTPQGYATQIIAAVACAGAGKRLCTTDEWRTACRGEQQTKFPYGAEYRAGVCNVGRAEHPAEMLKIDYTDGQLDPRMNTMSSAETGPLLQATGTSTGCASRWGNDAVYDMVGNLDEWSAEPIGVLLGGFFSRQTQEGCEAINTKHGPDYFNYSLGIRCCDRLQ
jgi:sulfatase modifying factor 1